MLRPALAAVACALVATAGAAPRARVGRVVRVERPRGKPAGTPRICTVTTNDLSAICFGKKPEVGDVITVVDPHKVAGVLRVDAVVPEGSCGQSAPWQVQTTLESGDLDAGNRETLIYGFLDAAMDPRTAHLVNVLHAPGDGQISAEAVTAVDTNGDDTADLEFLQVTCDDAGITTANAHSLCIQVWYAAGPRYDWLRTDRIQNCF